MSHLNKLNVYCHYFTLVNKLCTSNRKKVAGQQKNTSEISNFLPSDSTSTSKHIGHHRMMRHNITKFQMKKFHTFATAIMQSVATITLSENSTGSSPLKMYLLSMRLKHLGPGWP